MPDKDEQALRVLGLEPGATEQAIKDAYRDLVRVWHPDRFGSDARLRAKAQEKLKDVNAAFELLRGYRGFTPSHDPAQDGDHPRDPGAWRAPRAPAERASRRRGPNALVLVLSAIMIGFVATGLVVWRNGATWQFFAGREQTLAPANPVRTPAGRQPARRPPQEAPAHDAAARPTTGSLIVSSRPLGARVSFDGRGVGETPVLVTDVAPGEHRIEVTLDGKAYQPWSSSVVVTAGQQQKLLAVMAPTQPGR